MTENNNSQEQKEGQNQPSENIKIAVIEDEMKTAYLDYSMSVIIGRALPDVRDGLKPVHRRIMHAMNEMGLTHNKSFKKSARIVGEVLGKFHPHGDSAVYYSLVRMAQEFSLRYPLIKGQGNFGSVDGDSPAAMRYTEAKLEKISNSILADIDKETVDMRLNFDESLEEPEVLPTRIPNLLVNGSSGIAVGMATNIPPHNLSEIIDGTIHLLDNGEETEINDLIEIVKGPDFPTGAIIQGTSGIKQAYLTGRGKIKVKAVMHEEEIRNRTAIIVTEIPYQVNKAALIEQIADAVRDKRIEGISDLRDESDRKGMRIVIELKRDANIEVVKNQLLKHSRLQIGTGIIFLSIVRGEPKILGLKDMLKEFIDHRKDVVVRRTKYELDKAEKKAHLLEGLTKALNHIDPIIALIKAAKSAQIAKEELISTYEFSEEQSQAILDMKLQKLTGLEQDKIREDYKGLMELISELKSILESSEKVKEIIKQELIEVKELYGDERRTQIIEGEDDDIDFEDLIVKENQVINITQTGYAKRLPIDTYKLQNRGGKGVIGASMKEEDVIEHIFIANTHSYLLIFTDRGQAHWLKVYKIPEGTRQAKGKPLINLVNLQQGEKVAAVIPVEEFKEDEYLMMVTKKGIVKKTSLEAYSRPRTNGIIGITLDEGDRVVKVLKTTGNDQILIASEKGQAVKFNEKDARPIGRTSRGVRGISLSKDDKVIGMILAKEEETILTITENGYGKRTPISEYRLINRGGKGVRNIICSERNGNVASVRRIKGDEEILLITEKGIIVRIASSQISTIGRNTQGLRVMRLKEGDKVKGCAIVLNENEQEE